ncbi:unnamed protein product [Adineta steineri]|uniref:Vacuolar protein sorting-associated protein n=1 Tax=Adineta steineri TaxID=433720 RepID=A0A818ZQD2_9BILA|nr:unnamed protein product [Adineta steineri]
MVFKHLAVHLLDKYLGDYIENFDSKSLKVGLWHGNLTIENAYVKQNALDDLNIPVEIITGFIEKLTIHIPWKHFYTHPTKISIHGFYLLLKTRTEIVYNSQKYEEQEYRSKMKRVEKVEKFHRKREEYIYFGKNPKRKDKFFQRLKFHILRNLEITIENVHIQYQDKYTRPFHPFTFNLTFNYVKLTATNAEREDSKILFKLGEINNLSIYWSANIEPYDNLPKEDVIKKFKLQINEHLKTNIAQQNYILRPLNATAKFEIAKKPQKQDFQRPILQAKILFQEINLNMNPDQYADILAFLEFYQYYTTRAKYVKYYALKNALQAEKPSIRRWKFAYNVILNEQIRPRLASYQWKNIKLYLDRSKQYYLFYYQQITARLTKDEKQRMEELEKKINTFNLIYVRRVAEIMAKKRKPNTKELSSGEKLSNWWKQHHANDDDDPELQSDNILSNEERQELYEAIGYEDEQKVLLYPSEYIDIDISVGFNTIKANVWANTNENDIQAKSIACATISNTDFIYTHRPAKDDFSFQLDIDSLEMYGNQSELNREGIINLNQPVLIQSHHKSKNIKEKFLHIQFETHPLNQTCDYRIIGRLQSFDIVYHAVTIKNLFEIFIPDKNHHLEQTKEVAYSLYTDIKNDTQFLLNENVKKMKDLDISIDCQSVFIILPEHDVLSKWKEKFSSSKEILPNTENNQDIVESSSIPIKLKLENTRLVYCKKDQDWKIILNENDTSSYIIKPITIILDINKSTCMDDFNIPIWKVDGEITKLESQLSDKRIFEIVNVVRSMPLPQIKSSDEANIAKLNTKDGKRQSVKKIDETIEKMTSSKIAKTEHQTQSDQVQSHQQITQIQASFRIPDITISVEQCPMDLSDSNEPFIELSFVSIIIEAKMKTYDIEFNFSLEDFYLIHQQFETKDNKKLYLIGNQHNDNSKLLVINGLLTSIENPLFSSSPYNSIENKIHINFSQSNLNIQLEALTSILIFKNNIIKQFSQKQIKSDSTKTKKPKKKSKKSSFEIEFNLNEFHILIGNQYTQLLYIKLQGVRSNLSRSSVKNSIKLIIKDFNVIDPSHDGRFKSIISKENQENDLISINLSLLKYSKKFLNQIDSHIDGQVEKVNVFLLYKHIELIQTILNVFQGKKSKNKEKTPSNEPSFLQKQTSKLHFEVNINGPRIFIPKHSYSNEAILIDLGQLTVQTNPINNQIQSVIEEYKIIFQNLLVNRVKLNDTNQIEEHINLLDCSPLTILINHHLNIETLEENQAKFSIKFQWEQIDFFIHQEDYLFFIEIYEENFKEKIYHKIPQEQNAIEENKELSDKPVKKQKILKQKDKKIYQLIAINLLIKQINLTLYHDQNAKLLYLEFENIQIDFQQFSNATYNGQAQIFNLIVDYLYSNDNENSIKRIIDKNWNIEQDKPILSINLQYKPSNDDNSTFIRQVDGGLENFYICISPNYLISLKDFFTSKIAIQKGVNRETIINANKQICNDMNNEIPPPAKFVSKYPLKQESNEEETSVDDDSEITTNDQDSSFSVENKINLNIKSCQFIVIEDETNQNSNCLVLELSVAMRMMNANKTNKSEGSFENLTIYASNFEELKQSKIKYDILQPTKINVTLVTNPNEQIIDVRIGNISVNINPTLISTIASLKNSMGKQQTNITYEKDKINSKSIFDPKPFKDSSFWFIQDPQEKEDTLEQTDILEITTGTPSKRKSIIQQQNKQKKIHKHKNIHQQLTVSLKTAEAKIQYGSGLTTRPVLALCLSEIFTHLENWSTDLSITASIQIELALFNDHLLAWEPLIEPIIDQRSHNISPWSIKCQTVTDHKDENEAKYRFLLDDEKSLNCKEEEEEENDSDFDVKKIIFIRADHLLNITLTKTGVVLAQRLFKMFSDAYKKKSSTIEQDDQSILSIHNHTGYELTIVDLNGIEFTENDESNKDSILKNGESVKLTVPSERLDATHLPTIAEQVDHRKQEFSVKIGEQLIKLDINQTWRRVFEIRASPIPNWPIQMLCNSHIYEDRRRIILSSIIKITNGTKTPLIILDADSVETRKFHRIAQIDVNQEFYLPIDPLYLRSSPRLYFTIEQDDSMDELYDFISFDWANESNSDRVLKLKDGKETHYVIYKESLEAYSENTDEPIRSSFNISIQLAVHIINLLPINILCLIDNSEKVDLKSGELYHATTGNKQSSLVFTIPSHNNVTWISEPINIGTKGKGAHNEHIVEFHNASTNEIMRMVLRVDICRQAYRASFYSPYWLINSTDLKFQFQLEHEMVYIDTTNEPYFICPKGFHSNSHKKANIRLYSAADDESVSQWSEGFSVNVIKSTGIASCNILNDRLYMVCVNIVTSSFGMTKIITIAPSITVINNASIGIDIIETVSGIEQDKWKSVKPEEIIPFWPHNIKDGVMRVRYSHNIQASCGFSINDKHRTLLYMNDEELPAIDVQINITDFDGYRIVFSDYKNGDAPILIVNTLINQSITFNQKGDSRTQTLPPQNYVYYTWIDPFKPCELDISANKKTVTIKLNPASGVIEEDNEENIYYGIFHDGPQTVLLFSCDMTIIRSVTDSSLLDEPIKNYIQIIARHIGISIIDDVNRNDLLYITINQSKNIWVEKQKYNIRPISPSLNNYLEDNYNLYIGRHHHHRHLHHLHHHHHHDTKQEIRENRYRIDEHRIVSFNENVAEISDDKGNHVCIRYEKLDAIWIGYAWSISKVAIHARINDIQIDDQLEYTLFPTSLYPLISKSAGTDLPGKPFIELSVFKSKSMRSNTIHFKYFKLLIQEVAFCVDQDLILALFRFFKADKNPVASSMNMDTDIMHIKKPLDSLIQSETHKPSSDMEIYFDNLHLSPVKIHVSFSIHGSKPNKQLLAEHPLADFILEILNVAEVQDVILKLNFYERKNERYTINKLTTDIINHYEHQLLKQIHAVILGLDVLGNPFGVIRSIAHGVESFFYEPLQGAMEGPREFIHGFGTGTKYLVGSVVSSTAGALSKVTDAASKSLATLTLDKDYQNVKMQRRELLTPHTFHIVSSGKNTAKDIVSGFKGLVKKPVEGAKEGGREGFVKGVGKGFLGLVGKPTSGIADLTSTSLDSIKRVVTHEQSIYRIRHPRHIGRDGIIRPSIAHEMFGKYILDKIEKEEHGKTEDYIAHIKCLEESFSYFFATTRRVLLINRDSSSSDCYTVEWHHPYKHMKELPQVKFNPYQIEIIFKEINKLKMTKKDRVHTRIVPYRIIGEARYIVDKITETMQTLQI